MSDALISPCGAYRYTLGRTLDEDDPLLQVAKQAWCAENGITRHHKPCLFVMLNPSTADASLDDPTIRRCKVFAAREGCTFLTVVNLFALRATDPAELLKHADPFGPENLEHIRRELRRHDPERMGHLIVAAWGAHPMATSHPKMKALHDEISACGAMCFGTTKAGAPRHPLYLRSDAELMKWTPP